ncbi:glycosyl hydrolase family 20, partial [Streptomyces sp. SID6013]|nr:glycosyl hydrolase family 20 [Streptomyces sp. SID6013]
MKAGRRRGIVAAICSMTALAAALLPGTTAAGAPDPGTAVAPAMAEAPAVLPALREWRAESGQFKLAPGARIVLGHADATTA